MAEYRKKQRLAWSASAAVLAASAALVLGTTVEAAEVTDVVRPGDSLWAIAQRHGVSVTQLKTWNQLGSHYMLHPGQTLIVQQEVGEQGSTEPTETPTPSRPAPKTDTVRPGEGLWQVAHRNGLTLEEIMDFNPTLSPQMHLKVGQRVNVTAPEKTTTEIIAEHQGENTANGMTDTVRRGEGLWQVAQRNGLSLKELLALNPNVKVGDGLKVGQKLVVKGTSVKPAPEEKPTLEKPEGVKKTDKVQKGEGLWQVANRNGLTLKELLGMNPKLKVGSLLQVGQEVVVQLGSGQGEKPGKPVETEKPKPTNPKTDKVQKGEGLWQVAHRNGLSLQELLALNPGVSIHSILRIGQELVVQAGQTTPEKPETSEPKPEKPQAKMDTVQKGEGLWQVAHRNGLTLEELLKLNPGVKTNTILRVGQKLVVKGTAAEEPKPSQPEEPSVDNSTLRVEHDTVRPGDGLWAIAQRHGLTVKDILALNPNITEKTMLHPGQKLVVKKIILYGRVPVHTNSQLAK